MGRIVAGVCAGGIVLFVAPQASSARTFDPDSARVAQADKPLDAGVRETLRQYEMALESLDADAVKKVQPSIDVEGLKRAFREMRELEVDLDNIKLLSSDGTTTRVSCRVAQTLTPKVGSRRTTTVTRVLRLQRQDSAWIIQAFER